MRYRKEDVIQSYLYILPSFILICIFSLIPIAMNIFFSFTKYNIIKPPQLVGLKNYIRMLSDPYITSSIINTIVFTLITVPLQTITSLVFAHLIAEYFRGKFGDTLKSALFIPVIASSVLVGTLWSIFLEPHGPINLFLEFLHIPAVNWLGGKYTSMISICMATIWKNVGYFLVIFYAGVLDIPKERYEAAQVDGATPWQRFFHITLPGLSSVTYLVVTLGTIWSFQIFDMVFTMTGGGPGMSTVTLVLTIYNSAFKGYNMGYASAIALLLFALVLFTQAIQRKVFGDTDNE
ncbi:sugar ABC transporter permease [uncultured Sphaerochaeta sp.]|uniref:carbohydrate ABC transporter permease n=1 Tax=uncultured Sphaerochaeta sp. TaxID=886478 RepID=UPI002A0A3410|nr:sugar ABC transporter permease [uncultured Sphaerochaeta sp.]